MKIPTIAQSSVCHCFFNGDPASLTLINNAYILVSSQGQPYSITGDDLDNFITAGTITFYDSPTATLVEPSLTFEQQSQVDFWKPYLMALDRETYPGSLKVRKKVISRVAMRHHVGKNPPKPSTLYQNYRRYVAADRNALAVVNSVKKPSSVRASNMMISLFNEVMDDHYLKKTGALSVKRCYEIMVQRFNEVISQDPSKFVGEKIISQSQFYLWVNQLLLKPLDKAKKLSNRELSLMRRKAIQQFQLDQILERVEVDAAVINIGLLDDDGNYLGAPMVYAMIDCYSRSVLGIHVQVGGGECSSSVLHLYHQMLHRKNSEEFGCTNDWPMFGIPSTLVSDSGTGFTSHQVSAFLSQLQIANIKAEVRKPWKKPFIERFFQTCRTQLFSSLKGYVGKRKDQKELDINMKDAACITLKQFRAILTRYIVDDYHQRPHRGLSKGNNGAGPLSPYQVWQSQVKHVPSNVPANAVENFKYNKGIVETRKIQREGVTVKGITYQSSELDSLIHQHGLDYPVPCSVIFDQEDIGSVTVLLNKFGVKLIVPAKGSFAQLTGKSLHEYTVIKKAEEKRFLLTTQGQHVAIDETDIHSAANQQKTIKKAKATNRKANLDEIQRQSALMSDMHQSEFFESVHDTDNASPVHDEEEYEIV